MNKSRIKLLTATVLLVAILFPVLAAPVSAERSIDQKKIQSVLNGTREKAGSLAGMNATGSNISRSIDVMSIGQCKLNYYKQVMSKSELMVTNVSKFGIGTSGMESVIEGARTGVVMPLESAIDSGDEARVTNELKTKCLFNATSYSYHYAAKMDLEVMRATTAKIEKIVTIAGYGTEIQEVKTHLDNAEKALGDVGTRPYTPEESKYINTELMSASTSLAEIIKSMNEKAGY